MPSLTTILLAWGIVVPLATYGWTKADAYFERRHAVSEARKDEQAQCVLRAQKAGNKANEDAGKAHSAAARPGAAERLRKRACRDC